MWRRTRITRTSAAALTSTSSAKHIIDIIIYTLQFVVNTAVKLPLTHTSSLLSNILVTREEKHDARWKHIHHPQVALLRFLGLLNTACLSSFIPPAAGYRRRQSVNCADSSTHVCTLVYSGRLIHVCNRHASAAQLSQRQYLPATLSRLLQQSPCPALRPL